jgi:cytochrome c peroxidase
MKRLTQRLFLSTSLLLALALLGAIAQPRVVSPVYAEAAPYRPTVRPPWFAKVLKHYQNAPRFRDYLHGEAPASIPQHLLTPNDAGTLATFQPLGAVSTEGNGFFADLGTNGRTCFTCHQPQAGWAMNPATAQTVFKKTYGRDPLFAPVDGTDCQDTGAAARTLRQREAASSQLLTKGNIRIGLSIPDGAEYAVRVLRDPHGCAKEDDILSLYRRVLPTSNLALNAQIHLDFTTLVPEGAIMWDGREPSLASQFIDATLGHAQANPATFPGALGQANDFVNGPVNGGVPFELRLLMAQIRDHRAGSLTADGANGGAAKLGDPLIGGFPSTAVIPAFPNLVFAPGLPFSIYDAWTDSYKAGQASINRGQKIFNLTPFTMDGVSGFNDAFPGVLPAPAPGTTCSTCHNMLNMGGDAIPDGKHLGIGDNGGVDQLGRQGPAFVLPPTSDQPLFSFLCEPGTIPMFSNPKTVGGHVYDEFKTTDPGMALITGKCRDLGKFKVPRLRGLAARAPFFHGGNAETIWDVVEFYNRRFSIGLNLQNKRDLVNFLNSL